ncbi:hypothetical protein [Verrucosispora sp. WMMC514]|uniref:hypothetical protein n=1 Tax=Verrucosispora sp. WMMC514 TaxID=3015156 RepID=UPI00248D1492|nr:hypothetical protein [Verrucosispora sp. WMMC514]WBB94244.1 hypothetical protein O7597_15445 [Verrucosispora sp. WMMC514]
MADPGLFDAAAYQVEPAPVEKVSADRRRAQRQAAAIAAGWHPLGLALGRHLRLHPDAPRSDDRTTPGPRCGSCWYREVLGHHNRSYGKCTVEDGARISNGAGTDVRRWWPACRDYSPGDPQLSADAARYIPEAVHA